MQLGWLYMNIIYDGCKYITDKSGTLNLCVWVLDKKGRYYYYPNKKETDMERMCKWYVLRNRQIFKVGN